MVNDYITLPRPEIPRGNDAYRFERCEGIKVENVWIAASPQIGIHDRYATGKNTFQSVRIVPDQYYLRSSNAGGILSRYSSTGPVVKDCILQQIGDDGVAIYGPMADIVLLLGANKIQVRTEDSGVFKANDTIEFYAPTGNAAKKTA